ncbi:MAG: DEAD/DEAH box helicase family protein [Nocardioidaceae bacterium]
MSASVRKQRQDELKAQAERYAAQDAELAKAREQSATLEQEIVDLRAQVAAAKAANEARPADHDYDEAATRDLFIDLLLRESGWILDQPNDLEFEVSGMPNSKGTGYVDYVLWGNDGKPLGVVEAKRTRRDSKVGQQQAKLYADCLEAAYGQRPVIFYTNGYDHWLWDDTSYPPRQVDGFYTKDELALLVQRRTSKRRLAEVGISDTIVERHYQARAIRRIGEAFDQGRQREALVVMATGAGKTRTVIALVDLLMRANWAKRVLFLVDRVALVNQAVGAFKAHLPDAATVNLVTEKHGEGRVYVSTYPTMMGLINQTTDDERRFGPGYFDLVIIDEAHRSVYHKYRAIFRYFDSLLVGLTATPKDEIDRNTYSLFHLEDRVPTDNYDLSEAVAEGYLVPPRAVSVPVKFLREGIRYDDLSEAEKDQWDLADWGEDDPPDAITSDAVNEWLFNTDTVDRVLETLTTRGHHVAGGDRLGKTIIRRQEQQARRIHRRAVQRPLSRAPRIVRPRRHAQDRIRTIAYRCLLHQGEGAAHRDLRRHAGHGHRRARDRQPGVLQDRPLQDEVLADDRPGHPPVPRPVWAGRGEGRLLRLRLLPEHRVLQPEDGRVGGVTGRISWGTAVQGAP